MATEWVAEGGNADDDDRCQLQVYGKSDAGRPNGISKDWRHRLAGRGRRLRPNSADGIGFGGGQGSGSGHPRGILRRGPIRRGSGVRSLVRRSSSVVAESLPETPAGWAALVATAASIFLATELRLQRALTCPPLVYAQRAPRNDELRERLSSPPGQGILSRDIKPSLLVGTRSVLSSVAAYALPHFKRDDDECAINVKLRFREFMRMGADGAQIGIDWEVPPDDCTDSLTPRRTLEERRHEILRGPIKKPVVIILHGVNNDASFGYMRSLMQACTDKGWIAVGYNFRGCGGVPLKTPRGYTAAYTGDLRCCVSLICERMASSDVPVFIVGNSIGGNLITKYLGEEGYSGTLPPNVAGGVSLGNALHIHAMDMPAPWGEILGLGVRKTLFLTRDKWDQMSCFHFQKAFWKALLFCQKLVRVEDAMSPFIIRNDTTEPFAVRVGYRDVEEYWDDASSFKYVAHVSVPLLKLTAQDDFLTYGPSLRKMSHCLENPNVIVVKTKCGGHLGWQESPPDTENVFGFGTSWSDTATTDFIAAVIDMREEGRFKPTSQAIEDQSINHLIEEVGAGSVPKEAAPVLLGRAKNAAEEDQDVWRSRRAAAETAQLEADRIRSRL